MAGFGPDGWAVIGKTVPLGTVPFGTVFGMLPLGLFLDRPSVSYGAECERMIHSYEKKESIR